MPVSAASRILLVGPELTWIAPDARLAGRGVVHVATKEEALARLGTETLAGMIAGLAEMGKNLSLLNTAATHYPGLACGLRADPARVAGFTVAHPLLPATTVPEVMDDLVRTMFASAGWSADPAFLALKEKIHRIPALPTLYTQITNALQKEGTSLENLAELITREPTVSTKVLQVVNSAAFGMRQRVSSIRDAANILGIQRLRALVLSTSLIAQCDASRCQNFALEAFENHALRIADWASRIALGETRQRPLGELAFTAGLLHEFGSLLLAANLPESYDQVLRNAATQKVSIARLERQAYGASHAELAGFLLASWNIPFPIVNAVGFQSDPARSEETSFSPLTAVHLALAVHLQTSTGQPDFDRAYLEKLQLLPRLEYWTTKLTAPPDDD